MEKYEFSVDFATSLEQIERLREKMCVLFSLSRTKTYQIARLAFLEDERRDFIPEFNVTVDGVFYRIKSIQLG